MEVKYVLIFKGMDKISYNKKVAIKDAKGYCIEIAKNFGKLIKEKRETLGYSMAKTYKLSGVSSSTINDIEKGKYLPHLEIIFKIAYSLEISLEEVISCLTHFELKPSEDETLEYFKTLKKGDIIGMYSSAEKAETTIKNFTSNYEEVKEEFFDIREIVWD